MSKLYFVNKISSKNPFSPDGKYDENWVELRITDDAKYKLVTCKDVIFCLEISKANEENWAFRAMDYIAYHLALGRNVVYTGEGDDYMRAKEIYRGHSMSDPFLRPYEPRILVHSTTPNAYRQIMKDGVLKSWNKVNERHRHGEIEPIGALLGDPVDFRDYVMLGELGFWNEIIVSSKEKGYICMDADCEYNPGARFYFSTWELIKSGLFIRDGAHYKVRNMLPLSHSLFCATTDNVSINTKITPRTFAELADKAFEEYNRV